MPRAVSGAHTISTAGACESSHAFTLASIATANAVSVAVIRAIAFIACKAREALVARTDAAE